MLSCCVVTRRNETEGEKIVPGSILRALRPTLIFFKMFGIQLYPPGNKASGAAERSWNSSLTSKFVAGAFVLLNISANVWVLLRLFVHHQPLDGSDIDLTTTANSSLTIPTASSYSSHLSRYIHRANVAVSTVGIHAIFLRVSYSQWPVLWRRLELIEQSFHFPETIRRKCRRISRSSLFFTTIVSRRTFLLV